MSRQALHEAGTPTRQVAGTAQMPVFPAQLAAGVIQGTADGPESEAAHSLPNVAPRPADGQGSRDVTYCVHTAHWDQKGPLVEDAKDAHAWKAPVPGVQASLGVVGDPCPKRRVPWLGLRCSGGGHDGRSGKRLNMPYHQSCLGGRATHTPEYRSVVLGAARVVRRGRTSIDCWACASSLACRCGRGAVHPPAGMAPCGGPERHGEGRTALITAYGHACPSLAARQTPTTTTPPRRHPLQPDQGQDDPVAACHNALFVVNRIAGVVHRLDRTPEETPRRTLCGWHFGDVRLTKKSLPHRRRACTVCFRGSSAPC